MFTFFMFKVFELYFLPESFIVHINTETGYWFNRNSILYGPQTHFNMNFDITIYLFTFLLFVKKILFARINYGFSLSFSFVHFSFRGTLKLLANFNVVLLLMKHWTDWPHTVTWSTEDCNFMEFLRVEYMASDPLVIKIVTLRYIINDVFDLSWIYLFSPPKLKVRLLTTRDIYPFSVNYTFY